MSCHIMRMKEQMLHKTCRPYKNTGQIYHRALGNKSAKRLNCCRISSAFSLFSSVLFEWQWMSSRVMCLVITQLTTAGSRAMLGSHLSPWESYLQPNWRREQGGL